jgi:hypothetical protein
MSPSLSSCNTVCVVCSVFNILSLEYSLRKGYMSTNVSCWFKVSVLQKKGLKGDLFGGKHEFRRKAAALNIVCYYYSIHPSVANRVGCVTENCRH